MNLQLLALAAALAADQPAADTNSVAQHFLIGMATYETCYVIGVAEDNGSISPVDPRTFTPPVPLVVVNAFVPLMEANIDTHSAKRISALVLATTGTGSNQPAR